MRDLCERLRPFCYQADGSEAAKYYAKVMAKAAPTVKTPTTYAVPKPRPLRLLGARLAALGGPSFHRERPGRRVPGHCRTDG